MSLGELLEGGVVARPRRRLTMKIEIGADNREDLYRALVEIEREFVAGTARGATGRPSVGYSFSVEEDPLVTHDSYFEELERWSER